MMKLIKQCANTFIRIYNSEIGYIASELTKHDRIYDEIGAIFLKQLSREPQQLDVIIRNLSEIFPDVVPEKLSQDFVEFISSLEEEQFIVTGQNLEQLSHKEPHFSYKNRMIEKQYRTTPHKQREECSGVWDIFTDYFRKHPQIFEIQIALTSKCNQKCSHCYLPHTRRMQDIDFALVTDILDQTTELGTIGVNFSGGECFLHKDFDKILWKARHNDLSITILSNGTLINNEQIDLLKEIRISQLQVSLYSMRAEEHDMITQLPGSHARTLKAIQQLIEADIPVQISCPVMKINKNSYTDVLKWANRHKVKAYTDFVMMARTDFSTSNLKYRLNLEEAEKLIKEMLVYDQEYRAMIDANVAFMDMKKLAKKPLCGIGIDSICLNADGNFYPCSGFQGYVLGNARDKRLHDIWFNSPQIQYLRKITLSDFPECLQCEATHFCSKCLVRNFNESGGNMFQINKHFCDVAFLNKRLIEEYRQKHELTLSTL